MRTPAPSREDLIKAWPTAPRYDLMRMIEGLGSVLLSDIMTRQELVRTVRFVDDLADYKERILIAMGNLKYPDQNGQKSWWGFVENDVELMGLAAKAGLHTSYMLPRDTAELFSGWMEKGGGFHRAAQVVWDTCVSSYGKPSILVGVLDPYEFTEDHMEQWKGRVLDTWLASHPPGKADVIVSLLVKTIERVSVGQDEWVGRRRLASQWLEMLLDGSKTTIEGVRDAVRQIESGGGRTNSQLFDMCQAHLVAVELSQDTPSVAIAPSVPRPRI